MRDIINPITSEFNRIPSNQDEILDGENAKQYTSVEQTKLAGIEDSAASLATIKADADISDAVSKRHTQNADTDLDSTFEATLEHTANRGAVNGYAGLDINSKVPTVNLGGAGADASKYLRGDQLWATPTAALPEMIKAKQTTTESQTIATGYSAMIARRYIIPNTYQLIIQGTGLLHIV